MWDFMKYINEVEGMTIILTTHYLEEAEQLCKHIAILNHGEILINTEMKSLLGQLSNETFIFDLTNSLNELPVFDNITQAFLIDNKTLEITLNNHQSLNDVFTQFSNFNIQINSMRNKSNRLEELFMGVIDNHTQDTL